MLTKILRFLCVLLLVLLAFVFGVSLNVSKNPSVIDGAKAMVADFMYQPQAASFKNVTFYSNGTSMKNKVIGHVCGEVFTFKDGSPYKYKRFIVQVAASKQGSCVYSFPLFDFEGEIMSENDFQKRWGDSCE
ncbi:MULTISPECIES: hypothetical protein [Providencia]|uniref:hypothetical protein n=2 Tax=Morganellaceae TaxID=1903414 RepID=UPI0005B37929|nr:MULTISPECIES: hypothetical protein [Providencia]APC11211.1 hypothetical protein RB151_015310 [Providencia rettgeri]AVL74808.1 hypothetical protein CEQ08_14280 [Providencia rettgeri]EJD6042668.1 hypothetical protein [Providencia rettgeri]EJD6538125.1 hypothetical protein [Providencia rettgeri]EJD6612938.1 hypothetical protein [Providencia rettgeri]